MQSLISDLDRRLSERVASVEEQAKQDGEHKLMTISMINILDERVNGMDSRMTSLEKLTKDLHLAV